MVAANDPKIPRRNPETNGNEDRNGRAKSEKDNGKSPKNEMKGGNKKKEEGNDDLATIPFIYSSPENGGI